MGKPDAVGALSDALADATEAMTVEGGGIQSVADLRAWAASLSDMVPTELPEVARVEEVTLGEVDGRSVTADVIVPLGKGPFPVVVYLHGGGWVLGDAKGYRPLTFAIAAHGYVVVCVEYALAPELPFPAGFDDCVFAVRWAAEHAAEYGGDPRRLALAGDSAGANLSAAVTTWLAADAAGPEVRAVALLYGPFDLAEMWNDDPEAPPAANMILQAYLGDEPGELLRDSRTSPLQHADRLPASFITVGSIDDAYLLGQSTALAQALAAADVPHELVVVDGMPHAFMQLPVPAATETLAQAAAFLSKHLGG